ncbi:hypothetical protein E5D57_006069 [Metarhizium anisopliae]|nr:hypothetical protein E5D57_006069 [Metarhizium anisopliae]
MPGPSDGGLGAVLVQLVDGDADKGQAAAYALGGAADEHRVAGGGGRQEREVHVDRGARLLTQVVRADGQPGGEVDHGGADGAVEAALAVEVRGREGEPERDGAGGDGGELDVGEDEAVDGRFGEEVLC